MNLPAEARAALTRLARCWPLLLVLALGTLLRVAVAIAYRPAIFYNDSFVYVRHAYNAGLPGLVTFAPDRPAGYALILHVLGVSLAWVTSLQHLAGLVGGVLLYWLMRRSGVRRGLAAAGAAIVLLDSYAVTLEQLVLAEAFFTLAVTASAVLVVGSRRWWAIALSGALLALACVLRNTGYALIPVWLAFLIVRGRRDWIALAAAVAGFATVFGGYLIWQHSAIHRWSPYATTASGWFLYSRVAPFGSCRGVSVPKDAAGLCGYAPADRGQGPEYYLFSGGPGRRVFPDEYPGGGGSIDPAAVNHVLRGYAVAVIEARPFRYIGATLGDFFRFFEPGAPAYGDDFETFELQDEGRSSGVAGTPLAASYFFNGTPMVPGHPFWPYRALRSYQSVFHTSRWLLAVFVALALGSAVLRRTPRGRPLPARPEQIVLIGGPLLALLGQAATAQFAVRYEIPFVGLVVAGGMVAIGDLTRLATAHPGARAWRPGRRGVALSAAALVLCVAAVVIAVASGGGSGRSGPGPPIAPRGFTAGGLRTYVAQTLKQPVYWAGPRANDTYELRRDAAGNVLVRYLPPGDQVGDPRRDFLLVATYPFTDALPRLAAIAHGGGSTLLDGAFQLPDAAYPRSVHMAFPGMNYEVEVYDPSPAIARRTALSGAVRLIGR